MKYVGELGKIEYRSSYELMVFRWLDMNPDVIAWNSEGTCIPYICPTDNQIHRYYVDLAIKWKSGKSVLVEIKPENQTSAPTSKNKQVLLEQTLVWSKNKAKWEAAERFAKKNGIVFQVWTEKVLAAIGVPLINQRTPKKKRAS